MRFVRAVFSARPYDRRFLDEANQRDATGQGFAFVYFDAALDVHTAALAQDCAAVCVFVNDRLDAPVLHALHALGVRAVLLRCAGFNNVDLAAAKALDLFVARMHRATSRPISSSTGSAPNRRGPSTRWRW